MAEFKSTPNGSHKSLVNGVHDRPEAGRKNSSPLMPAFMVSAPGKVIVFGEHAVVHGKAAIAAAISLRSYLLVTFLSKSKRTVRLLFPDIDLDHTWNIDELPWAAFAAAGKKKSYYDHVTALDPDLVEAMQSHIADVSANKSENDRKIHRSSASAFLYLFLSLGSVKSPPCVYTLRSTIPIGAGLGSSATIAVCFSAAILLQIRALAGPHEDQPPEECETQIQRINQWAFVGEMCIHGNPSGVDNTVSSGGKAVLFRRRDYTKRPDVKPLLRFPELPLLLVNTRQPRSTTREIGKVTRLRETHPIIAEKLLEAIDEVTKSAHGLISSDDFDPDDPEALQHLGELITVNHGLLVGLGVSHPKLERIRELIDYAGIGWTKLTGAGGGGCAITLLKPECLRDDASTPNGLVAPAKGRKRSDSTALHDMEAQIKEEGFEMFSTTLAGDGVGILWPAVLHNSSGEEGGEEIDQEKFLNADSNDAIEDLVGVASSAQRQSWREGWKFWRQY